MNEDGIPRLDVEQEMFQIDSSELGAKFVEKWWPVAPQVVQLITSNPANPQAVLTHIPAIGKKFSNSIGIPDGIEILESDQDPSFLRRYGLTDEDIFNIRSEIQTALQDFSVKKHRISSNYRCIVHFTSCIHVVNIQNDLIHRSF